MWIAEKDLDPGDFVIHGFYCVIQNVGNNAIKSSPKNQSINVSFESWFHGQLTNHFQQVNETGLTANKANEWYSWYNLNEFIS